MCVCVCVCTVAVLAHTQCVTPWSVHLDNSGQAPGGYSLTNRAVPRDGELSLEY